MRSLRVLLCVAGSAWVAGNVLLIAVAPVLFAHTPKYGRTEFTDFHAAGAVFGEMLERWSRMVDYGLLPAFALGAIGTMLAALHARRTTAAWLSLLGLLAAGGCHLWSDRLIGEMNPLLADLRAGRVEGNRWSDFERMHRQSRVAVGGETALALAVALAAAAGLSRREASAPATDG